MQFLVKELLGLLVSLMKTYHKKTKILPFFFRSVSLCFFFAIFNVIEQSKVYKVNALAYDAS